MILPRAKACYSVREPDADPHVRFDERRLETELRHLDCDTADRKGRPTVERFPTATAPVVDSTVARHMVGVIGGRGRAKSMHYAAVAVILAEKS